MKFFVSDSVSSLSSSRLKVAGVRSVVKSKFVPLFGMASLMIVTLPQLLRSIGKLGAASLSCELAGLPPVRLRMWPLLKPGQLSSIPR